MRPPMLCVFALIMFIGAQGEEKEQSEQLLDMDGLIEEEEEESLQCFRCDLGFWDTCYTTETNCSLGEQCFTGRGKAADVLDVKTLGCAKAEECGVETTVALFPNNTIFVMTKHCCDTPFCNSAHRLQVFIPLCLSVAFLTTWHVSEALMRK